MTAAAALYPEPDPRARDMALAERLRRGEAAAFEELHATYRPRVHAFALRRLRDPGEAEDVAQEVFLRAWRGIDRFEGRSSLLTWMLGIAHRDLCDRFRRRGVPTVPLDEGVQMAAPAVPVEEALDAARALDACVAALETRVSRTQRELFELRYRDNHSVATIARQVGKSRDAVKVGLFRTRRTLSESAPEALQVLS